MDLDDEVGDFFGEDDLFGDTEAIGDDEAIEDNRYDGKENSGEVDKFLKKEKKAAASTRKKVHPRALLNERSLIMPETGIAALRDAFRTYKPDPKGDPYAQLPGLLKRYQHWAHVLAPTVKFENVISRVEQIGSKRIVRVQMDKMRMGMPITDSDFEDYGRKRKKDEGEEHSGGLITTGYRSDGDEDDDGGDREMPSRSPSPTKAPEKEPEPVNKPAPRSLFGGSSSSSATGGSTTGGTGITVASGPSAAPPAPLTEEQRRQIAENRLRALALREKKLAEEREKLARERGDGEKLRREREEEQEEERAQRDREEGERAEREMAGQEEEMMLDEAQIMDQFDFE